MAAEHADSWRSRLGWNGWFEHAWSELGRPGPLGRVARVDRGWATVLTSEQAVPAQPERRALDPTADVAVGDWVVVGPERIGEVLPRRSALARRAADGSARAQVLAANVDTVLLVHSLAHPPNARRLERELALVFESGAEPVVVLNKADTCPDVDEPVAEVAAVALTVPVLALSARTGDGLAALDRYTRGHHTVALLGPSGAGKSTLVNALAGGEGQRTGAVRADQRGRHTTTAAQLVELPGGGLLLDTPGLRAVALWSEGDGLARAFDDITVLAERCRFADCHHDQEPDCAVREAVAEGRLDPLRLQSWRNLDAELARLRDERARAERAARRGRPVRPPHAAEDDEDDEDEDGSGEGRDGGGGA